MCVCVCAWCLSVPVCGSPGGGLPSRHTGGHIKASEERKKNNNESEEEEERKKRKRSGSSDEKS